MHISCPHCRQRPDHVIDFRTIVRHGRYRRTSDSRSVERFKCRCCQRTFSKATTDECRGQKKRHKNRLIFELLASGVSGRRTARLLRIDRATVARKLIFLGQRARRDLEFDTAFRRVDDLQFDDLETFEHSKCKQVSVTLAVESGSRRILGLRVAAMAAKGPLARKARSLYGPRADERARARKDLFRELETVVTAGAVITSDANPYYVRDVKRHFPHARHVAVLGRRGAITGQGELKKIGFDPLFSLNHTCAMFRANVCRLIRKTWCTTKKRERLADHLAIYAVYHNANLTG